MPASLLGTFINGEAANGTTVTAEFNYGYTYVNTHQTAAPIDHPDGSVVADKLASNSVTTIKINADAVNGAKIADDSIDSEHYVDGSIDTAHLSALCVTTAKCAAGVAGFHGFLTRIPLLPRDFVSSSVTVGIHDHGPTITGKSFDAVDKIMFATVKIPSGYKATAVAVYGSATNDAVQVYECFINNITATSKGTGTVDASGTDPAPDEIDITDVTASATNYLSIVVENSAQLWGGYVTIAEV
jgi:hypothetical protein